MLRGHFILAPGDMKKQKCHIWVIMHVIFIFSRGENSNVEQKAETRCSILLISSVFTPFEIRFLY